MVTLRIPDLEQAEDLYLKIDTERQCTMAQKIDQDTEGKIHQEELQEITLETSPETDTDTDTEDIQTGVAAEKEEDTMMKTGIGRPAMATRAGTERVARIP